MVPDLRVRSLTPVSQPNSDGRYILYWMTAFRRPVWNFALQRAADWARDLKKPLLVFEPLRCGYHWASDRLHRFVVEGMADNGAYFRRHNITYFPYVEPAAGDGRGLLESLSRLAAVIVTDDYPCFFLPRMLAEAAQRSPVRMEAVDSNGLLPLAATDRVFARAYDFRRFLQRNLPEHLTQFPEAEPVADSALPGKAAIPKEVRSRWPAADLEAMLKPGAESWSRLPIDHAVPTVDTPGGRTAAQTVLDRFLADGLPRYETDRNEPDGDASSGLSPYLHFGHISAHQVFREVTQGEDWDQGCLSEKATGSKAEWWGLPSHVEAFLDELITWREVGFNMSAKVPDYDGYDSLPEWARKTLEEHSSDPRPYEYGLDEFESANTDDELWNAAQRQLLREGRMHNYLRMLWGKKILHWSPTPQDALDVMIELNNKYALDGRDPNSYSGIFWVLGRYDRAWGPERPIFGKVRYMCSKNTARKLNVKGYLARYAAE